MREKSRSVIEYLKHACCTVDLQKWMENLGYFLHIISRVFLVEWYLKTKMIVVDSSEEKSV